MKLRRGLLYLRGAKDDSVIVLSSAGSFFLVPAETDGHWAETVVHSEEILVFCNNNTVKFNRDSAVVKYDTQREPYVQY